MGFSKQMYYDMQEDDVRERKETWIRDKLGNQNANEDTPGWYDSENEYERMKMVEIFNKEYEKYEDYLSVFGKSPYDLFSETIINSNELLDIQVSQKIQKNLLVMLYGHIIAAMESYLSSTFIQSIKESENALRALVETDPEFAKRKFSMKEIFQKKETLRDEVAEYLKNLVFHEIRKVKPMYKDVLNIDFGDVEWLFEAVVLRHHCVHRAGYNKDGSEIEITIESIRKLSSNCENLAEKINEDIKNLP